MEKKEKKYRKSKRTRMGNSELDMGQSTQIDPKPDTSQSQKADPEPGASSTKMGSVKQPVYNPFTGKPVRVPQNQDRRPGARTVSVPQNQDQSGLPRKIVSFPQNQDYQQKRFGPLAPASDLNSAWTNPDFGQYNFPFGSTIRIDIPRQMEPEWLINARSPTCPLGRYGSTLPLSKFFSSAQFHTRPPVSIGEESMVIHYIRDESVDEPPPEASVEVTETFLQLSCYHVHEIKCDPTFKFDRKSTMEMDCMAPCARIKPCGHPCRLYCFEECKPCEKKAQKNYACGHPIELPCINLATISDACEVMVLSKARSSCHHPVMVPCAQSSKLSPNEVAQRCTALCGQEFTVEENGCAHTCTGTCVECRQGRFHVRCTQPCGRTLICSHVCTTDCSKHCPPCKAVCEVKCEHRACKQQCGVVCKPCKEPCTWECPHQKCTKECDELCDREPCDEPCPKLLPCDHPCISFCGEPCPTLCRICDKDELEPGLILSRDTVEETDRFILLPNCGHAIEKEVLDGWMNTSRDDGEIYPKACPLCKKMIFQCRRYNAILHRIRLDFDKIRGMIFGNTVEIRELENQLYNIHQFGSNLEVIRCPDVCKHLYEYMPLHRKTDDEAQHNFRFNLQEIRSLVHIATIWLNIELKLEDLARTYSKACMNILSLGFNRTIEEAMDLHLPFRTLELRDFHRQLDRFHDLIQLYKRRSYSVETHPSIYFLGRTSSARRAFDEAQAIAWLWSPYDERRKQKFRKALLKLDNQLVSHLGISNVERESILGAVNLSAGRWFKCANGHIYLITECGGATERASCSECGLPIGGERHRLLSNNTLATEMDGALVPLYPTVLENHPQLF